MSLQSQRCIIQHKDEIVKKRSIRNEKISNEGKLNKREKECGKKGRKYSFRKIKKTPNKPTSSGHLRISRVLENIFPKHFLTPIITYCLTHSMEQSLSREAKRFSASQEISRILRNPNVHYRFHNSLPSVPILSHIDPVHAHTSHFLQNHLNITLPSMPGSSKWSLSFRSPLLNPVYATPLPHACYMPHPSHSSPFYHPNTIGLEVQII
jgi:hypothetical protein